MGKLAGVAIRKFARSLIAEAPSGLRWSEIVGQVIKASPGTTPDAVQGALHQLVKTDPSVVRSKGVYALASQLNEGSADATITAGSAGSTSEKDFYSPIAKWIVEVDEATHAEPVGGNILGSKWGTPDVVGVRRPKPYDVVKFEPRVIAIEVKIDAGKSVEAFGQAAAYRLFAHQSYLAMPSTMQKGDLDRLEALAGVHGIGLILFDPNPAQPNFVFKVRAFHGQPDLSYMTEATGKLATYKLLTSLFG